MARKTKNQIVSEFYDSAMRIIADDDFYIVNSGNMKAAEFANCASRVFRSLLTMRFDTVGWMIASKKLCISIVNSVEWRIFNSTSENYVYCSRDVIAGVARSLAPIFPLDEDVENLSDETITKMLNMMDEAWFMMKQKEVL